MRRKYTFDNVSNPDLRQIIQDWIKGDRNQEMAEAYFIHLYTIDEISEKFSLSTSQARDVLLRCGAHITAHVPAQ